MPEVGSVRALGAEVWTVPAKPYSNPDNYNHIARRLAEEHGWFSTNQFDNTANRQARYQTTGPEIWEQIGAGSAFVASVSTGGTLAGTSLLLKERNSSLATDPYGAAMRSWSTIVTILCNSGHKYLSKLHNKAWLAENGLNSSLPLESVMG
ncbi:MAG: pyridoxal-phosphate dependent enzyme [Verrucomicrobiaceae bacterium]|nr:MAG: pyridoxal-phosphate dependent enzyme [Verrucomicrobiaceae bacterium]